MPKTRQPNNHRLFMQTCVQLNREQKKIYINKGNVLLRMYLSNKSIYKSLYERFADCAIFAVMVVQTCSSSKIDKWILIFKSGSNADL